MQIILIAAMGRNKVIGNQGALPWDLPEDMKRFRALTLNKPIIMGRKTFESIGRPLPNRANIILTRDKNYQAQGALVVNSVEDALKSAGKCEEAMIIGGAQVYKQFLPLADKMYLTLIDNKFDGDAFFPEFNPGQWREVSREEHKSSTGLKFAFVTLERNK